MNDKTKILLISSQKEDYTFFSKTLLEQYELLYEENYQKGLELLFALKLKISLIIVDLEVDNFEARRLVLDIKNHNLLKDIPILAIIKSLSDVEEVITDGIDDFLSRPLNDTITTVRLKNLLYKNYYYGYQLEENLRKTNYQIIYNSRHDFLTKIYNRETFYEEVQKFIQINKDIKYYIVLWDISRFKVINDLYGKEIGDKMLVTMADFFTNRFRKSGIYGRLDADHFGTCLPESELKIQEMIKSARDNLRAICKDFDININVGIYKITDIMTPVDQMCSRASIAKDSIKGSYMERYAFYDENLRNRILEEQEIINDLYEALKTHQFFINYQPIYSISSNRTIAAEALVRWKHPQKGIISPGTFIPVLERTGKISRLDYYVWEEVCKFLKSCKMKGLPLIPISVNVSRINFYNPNLVTMLCELVQKYQIEPGLFRIEITESAYTDNQYQLFKAIDDLKRNGFIILMDDFGSGFSSLNLLKDMPIDILKIDIKFIEALDISNRADSILSSIIRMVKWLEIAPIAEGVETQKQFDYLKSVGCDRIQGYFYSRPLSQEDYIALLSSNEQGIKNYVRKKTRVSIDELGDLYSVIEKSDYLFSETIGAIGICELNDDQLEIIKANEEFFKITFTNTSSFYQNNKNEISWIHEDDRKYVLQKCHEALQTDEVIKLNFRRYNSFADILWMACRIRRLQTKDVKNLLCFSVVDIDSIILENQNDQILPYVETLRLSYDDCIVIDTQKANVEIYKKTIFSFDKVISINEFENLLNDLLLMGDKISLQKIFNENKEIQIKGDHKVSSILITLKNKKEYTIDVLRFSRILNKNIYFFCVKPRKKYVINDTVSYGYQFGESENGRKNVMIVDDSVINRKIISKMLSPYYNIIESENGSEALKILRTSDTPVSAILLDLEMPIMNGYDFLKIRQKDSTLITIPIIVLSQNTSKEAEIKSLELGACEFLKKPYEPVIIIQRLNNIIRLKYALEDKNAIRFLLNNLPAGVLILDVGEEVNVDFYDNGFLDVIEWDRNKEFTSLADLFITNKTESIIDSDISTTNVLENMLNKIRKDGEKYHSFYLEEKINAGNKQKWVGIKGNYVGNVGGISRFYVTVTDINKTKLSEMITEAQKDVIKNQYSTLDCLYKSVPCGIIQFSSEIDPIISFANDSAQEYINEQFGLGTKDIVLYKIVHPDDIEYTKCIITTLEIDKNVSFENRIINNQNEIRWINGIFNKTTLVDGQTVIQCAFFDITKSKYDEQKIKEEQLALKQANKKYEIVISYSGSIVWEYDLINDVIYFNDDVAIKLRINNKYIKNLTEHFNNDKIIYENELINYDVIRKKLLDGAKTLTHYLFRKDEKGTEKYFQVSYVTLFDSSNKANRAIGFARDCTKEIITSQKYELEKEYRKAYANEAILFIEWDLKTDETLISGSSKKLIRWNKKNKTIDNLQKLASLIIFVDNKNLRDEDKIFDINVHEFINNIINNEDNHYGYYECQVSMKNSLRWISISYYYIINPINNNPNVFFTICDINSRKIKELQTLAISKKDTLSDLLNRTAFEAAIKEGIESYHSNNLTTQSAFIMLDIDNFKAINDNFGHKYGDDVIRKVSSNISKHFGSNNLISRLGGDEFAVFYKDISSVDDVLKKANDFCHNVFIEDTKYGRIVVNCSIGISIFPYHGTTFEALYTKADEALYWSKREGKCQCCLYDEKVTDTFKGLISNNDWLLNTIDILVWIVEVDTKNILYANAYFKKIVSDTPEGRKWYNVIPEKVDEYLYKNAAEVSYDEFIDLGLIETINGHKCKINAKKIKWNGYEAYLTVGIILED